LPVRVLLSAGLLLAASCSGQKVVYPVTGQILVAGRPAAGAVVQFHPQDQPGKDAPVPVGHVAPDGRFRLTTYAQDDGAPAGRYAVTVFWAVPAKGGDNFDRLLVHQRYLNPATSGLTADVPERAIEVPPFLLTK
jgi:hypothetical protein